MILKPLKLSTGLMLVALALFCLAAGLFAEAERYYHDVVMEDGSGRAVFAGMRVTGFSAIGAGIGTILRRPFLFAAIFLLIVLVWASFPTVY